MRRRGSARASGNACGGSRSEFEKYQVTVAGAGGGRRTPQLRARDEAPACAFDGLEPGAPYTVTVKTMSGKVTSWPAATDLTLSKPTAYTYSVARARPLRLERSNPPKLAILFYIIYLYSHS